jgi:hypothetical protein
MELHEVEAIMGGGAEAAGEDWETIREIPDPTPGPETRGRS